MFPNHGPDWTGEGRARRSDPFPPEARPDVHGGDLELNWQPIARVRNLAEAGFLADLLAADDIDSLVRETQDFDAVHAIWRQWFTVYVNEVAQSRAVEIARQEAEAAHADLACAADEDWPNDSLPRPWKSASLIVLAATLGWLGATTHISRHGVDEARRDDVLWRMLMDCDSPLVSDHPPGERRMRLTPRPPDVLIWELDADGDGRFDKRRELHRPAGGR